MNIIKYQNGLTCLTRHYCFSRAEFWAACCPAWAQAWSAFTPEMWFTVMCTPELLACADERHRESGGWSTSKQLGLLGLLVWVETGWKKRIHLFTFMHCTEVKPDNFLLGLGRRANQASNTCNMQGPSGSFARSLGNSLLRPLMLWPDLNRRSILLTSDCQRSRCLRKLSHMRLWLLWCSVMLLVFSGTMQLKVWIYSVHNFPRLM